MPVITCDLAPGETVELPALVGYKGPVGLLMGNAGGLRGPLVERAVTLDLPCMDAIQRQRCWHQALDGHPAQDLPKISARFHLPGGHIRRAAQLAVTHAALERRQTVTMADVRHACRALNRQQLDTLAVRLEDRGTWDRLVVGDDTTAKLLELESRCRHRERIGTNLGKAFAVTAAHGVRAIFTGGSGTGKTLAAKILAAQLDTDLYRVDLAAVVNKYIGETEKNLHRVLTRAEELDVILLLDEGDALLGRRSEVRSANDRYANLETDYLLQRLENYQGIVVVTTNAGENIDKAFWRRMDMVIHFVAPQAHQRFQIWQLHLPKEHQVEPAFLEHLALKCELTGGQIRNAALHANLLALEEGNRTVSRLHLEAAVQSEYRKAGALFPLSNAYEVEHEDAGFEAFFEALSERSAQQ
jgi:SpoVK/Ycf46/Vps4 family AAA+-type ATPase